MNPSLAKQKIIVSLEISAFGQRSVDTTQIIDGDCLVVVPQPKYAAVTKPDTTFDISSSHVGAPMELAM